MKLRIKGTHAIELAMYPGDDTGPTQVLVVSGIFSPPLAEKLGIREGCYNEEGIPHHYASFPTPMLRIDGADVQLGDRDFRSTLIHKFKISQEGSGNDVSLTVKFRMHFDGKTPLFAWLQKQNKEEFILGVNARQEDLLFGDEPAEQEEGEEAEGEELDTGCIACNNRIPFADGTTERHDNGQMCTATRAEEGQTLAPAAVVAGGTPGRKRRTAAAPDVH